MYPIFPPGASESDKQKAIEESKKVAALLAKSSDAQRQFMKDLASRSDGNEYLVPASEWVEKLMKATEGLTPDEIAKLKDLNWKPGKATVEELKEQIKKALKSEKPRADADDKPKQGDDEKKGDGDRGKTGSKQGDTGREDKGDKKKGKKDETGGGGRDAVTDPPSGWKREAKGEFRFVIVSGMTGPNGYKEGEQITVSIRVSEPGRTFVLDGLKITFVSGGGYKATFYFTKDFYSKKYDFPVLGGPAPENRIEYEFPHMAKKRK